MIVFKEFDSLLFLKRLFLWMLIGFSQLNFAQKTLVTIGNEKISVDEFEQVYQKNNEIIVNQPKQDLANYLDLLINFKLKLMDARKMGLDTSKTYQSELLKYRAQLVEPFLKDDQTVASLAKEAYSRLERDVNASHILIQLAANANPTDTLAAYTKILEAREKISNGAPFEVVAKAYSQDPSVLENGGDLGYFTAFNMVYPFETACYNTKVGEISQPFRTQFGYHIAKVNDNKPSKGEIEVAHIMLHASEDVSKIEEIYQKLQNGASFETLAKEFSIDKNSAVNGGKMAKFRAGRLVKEFEDVAFNLQEGALSKPFKTVYGWHIVKLIKNYPLPTYQEMEAALKMKVQSDQRSEIITKNLVKKLKTSYKFTENLDVKSKLNEINLPNADETLIIINQHSIKVKQFQDYLKVHSTKNLADNYNDFFDYQLIEYHKENLEKENPAFAAVMKEYQEGLLLFEILQRKIWEPSEKDTLGLKIYYQHHLEDYQWSKRLDGTVISSNDEETLKAVLHYLNEGNSIENIKKVFTKNTAIIDVKSGIFEQESLLLPKSFDFSKGISKIYHDNGKVKLVVVKTILEPSTKTIEEAKGQLLNDYQQYLDQQWIAELRKSIQVHINKKELNNLLNKYQQ